MRSLAGLILLLLATPAAATAQTAAPELPTDRAVVRIEVLQPLPYANYSLTLTGPDCSDRPRREACLARMTSAEMQHSESGRRITDSDACPALSKAFSELAALPPLRRTFDGWEITPPPRRSNIIGPTKKDGASYRFTLPGHDLDGEALYMVLNDYDGDYGRWADRLSATLADCWTPAP